jgi:hypothetical protein
MVIVKRRAIVSAGQSFTLIREAPRV